MTVWPKRAAISYPLPSLPSCFCAFPPVHSTALSAVILRPSSKITVYPFSRLRTRDESITSIFFAAPTVRLSASVSAEACLPSGYTRPRESAENENGKAPSTDS